MTRKLVIQTAIVVVLIFVSFQLATAETLAPSTAPEATTAPATTTDPGTTAAPITSPAPTPAPSVAPTPESTCGPECDCYNEDSINQLPSTVLTMAMNGWADGHAACPDGGPAVCDTAPADEGYCVYAAAWAAVYVSVTAYAESCITCNGTTVCAYASATACAEAFAYAYAYACAGGGGQ